MVDTGAVFAGTGSYYELAEAAETAAGCTVALADLVEVVDMVVLPVGLVELAGTVAWVGLVVLADTVAWAGLAVLAGNVARVGLAVLADNHMPGTAGYAHTVVKDNLVIVADTDTAVLEAAGVVGTVGLGHTVVVVGSSEVAAGIADIVAATEWQPYLTAMTPGFLFLPPAKNGKGDLP